MYANFTDIMLAMTVPTMYILKTSTHIIEPFELVARSVSPSTEIMYEYGPADKAAILEIAPTLRAFFH
jgi:hypothetical protein